MSSEDRLFAAPVQSRMSLSCPALQQQPAPTPPLFSVVGGRLVQQPTSSASPFPLNGQQLQLQLLVRLSLVSFRSPLYSAVTPTRAVRTALPCVCVFFFWLSRVLFLALPSAPR